MVVVVALIWGLVLALMRQLPGKKFIPLRFLTIAYIDILRAVPLLIIILLISGGVPFLDFIPERASASRSGSGKPDPFWYGVAGPRLRLRRLHRRGLPGGDRSGPRRPDGGGAVAGDEPRPGDAPHRRPPGGDKIPAPMLNEMNSLLKDTTLVSVVALGESVLVGREILAETFNSSAVMLAGLCSS